MKELVDKIAVKQDYEAGFSVRMLAAKYGVPRSTISDWIKRYGWVQLQKRNAKTAHEILTDERAGLSDTVVSEFPDGRQVSDYAGRRTGQSFEPLPIDGDYAVIREYTMKLLGKADALLEIDDALAPRDLKCLSGMLLDVRQLLNILSPREAAEQELRMITLRKQAEAADKVEQQAEQAGTVVRFVDTEGAEE